MNRVRGERGALAGFAVALVLALPVAARLLLSRPALPAAGGPAR